MISPSKFIREKQTENRQSKGTRDIIHFKGLIVNVNEFSSIAFKLFIFFFFADFNKKNNKFQIAFYLSNVIDIDVKNADFHLIII